MANTHRIVHKTSGHKEDVTKDTIETLRNAKLLKNYDVEELKPVSRPSETVDTPTSKKPAADK